ncbi:hypothetical protein ACQPXM_24510 [Kribbella sp. CA-253562]
MGRPRRPAKPYNVHIEVRNEWGTTFGPIPRGETTKSITIAGPSATK